MEQDNKFLHSDCFAFNNSEKTNHECLALTERTCNNTNCRFHKRWEDCDETTRRLINEQKNMFGKK